MVAELVETSRLWGRTAARIDPKWVEPLAEHLVKRTYEEPRWERKRASGRRHRARDAVRAADRRRPHGRLRADRPGARRASCSSAARWSRATGTRATLLRRQPRAARGGRGARGPRAPARHPRRRPGAVRLLRTRGSRPTSSPARTSTAGGATSAGATGPADVHARAADQPAGRGAMDPRARPRRWRQGDLDAAALATASSPGAAHDGVTVHVPLSGARPQLRAGRLRVARARRCAPSSSTR